MDTIDILLIEDGQGDQRVLRSMLEDMPGMVFDILLAQRLQIALHLLEAKKPDIILVDLELPDSRGLETFQSLKQVAREVPIIIYSGLEDEESALEALRLGAQDYLVKGQFDSRHLLRVIRYALERHRILSELNQAGRALERLITIDPLTSLLNRRGFDQALHEETARLRRRGETAFALLLDLDDFRSVNDTLGHVAGDILLKEIGAKIENSFRSTHIVARIGGNEFVILLSEIRQAEALLVAEKLRLAVAQSPVAISQGENVFVSCSMGMTELEGDMDSVDELLQLLRLSMARSKKNGKNKVSIHTQSVSEDLGNEQDSLARVLEQMTSRRNFFAVMQPIINFETGERTGAELFSRFSHGEFGLPEDFFRLAREAKLLALIDRLCLRTCLTQALEAGLTGQLHINLFPSTLMDIPTSQLLMEFGGAENQKSLCVEISEQQVLSDPAHLLEAVKALKQAGLSVAVDDVGFGRSCLESLIVLEPDIVKIDKRCISGIDRDLIKQKLMKRLLGVIRSLDAEVIAEGVETQEELTTLTHLGVRFGQGYFWGRPVPVIEPVSLV